MSLLSVAVFAEYFGFKTLKDEGYGFRFLLYKPFDMAYPILAFVVFLMGSIKTYFKSDKNIISNLVFAFCLNILWTVMWFIFTFLTVASVHSGLGGRL